MFRTVEDFIKQWNAHNLDTLKVMEQLTDASLAQPVADGHRNLGRIAWHIVLTIPEMCGEVGLEADAPSLDAPVPTRAADICEAYRMAAASVATGVESTWNNDTLLVEDQLYGETWKRGLTLYALVVHEVQHRGQMTVLMRQAGLDVPGTFGPSKEEWVNMGMSPPAV